MLRPAHFLACALGLSAWFSIALAQELPQHRAGDAVEDEPKLILSDLPDIPLPAPTSPEPSIVPEDLARAEARLAEARQRARTRGRLFREGILSKVEAERAELEVVRQENELAALRARAAASALAALAAQENTPLDPSKTDAPKSAALLAAEAQARESLREAAQAAARWTAAQREAAQRRVARERQLYALGAGSKTAVQRAEAALQKLLATVAPIPDKEK